MKVCLALWCLGVVHASTSSSFEDYVAKYGKTYPNDEAKQKAKACWSENTQQIVKWQAMNSLATFGENHFTDECFADFQKQRMGAKFDPKTLRKPRKLPIDSHAAAERIVAANPSVDWRTSGAVQPIQDQAQCGSCWAFGTVASIEAQHFLWAPDGKNGTAIKLSEQELVSCDHYSDKTGQDKGCQGGWPDRALNWMKQNGGLTSEKNYPYTSQAGKVADCDTSKEKPKALNILDFQDLGANETYVAAYVAKYGPVVIGLDATSNWQSYTGGILTAGCEQKNVDHAVVIVGYGSDSGQDYWIIRNSWATKWGENGYIRLARGTNCNNVVSHVVSPLFGERSLCLEDCGKSTCCGGDCCDVDGGSKCCADDSGTNLGCATKDMTCCGSEGGYMPCGDDSLCCGSTCCDGADSKCMATKQGATQCCEAANVCGDVCLANLEKCCHGHVQEITDTCCAAGNVCPLSHSCCGGTCCEPMDKCEDNVCVNPFHPPSPPPSPPTPAPPPPSPPTPSPPSPTPPAPPSPPTPPTPPSPPAPPSPGPPCPHPNPAGCLRLQDQTSCEQFCNGLCKWNPSGSIKCKPKRGGDSSDQDLVV